MIFSGIPFFSCVVFTNSGKVFVENGQFPENAFKFFSFYFSKFCAKSGVGLKTVHFFNILYIFVFSAKNDVERENATLSRGISVEVQYFNSNLEEFALKVFGLKKTDFFSQSV